MIAAEDGYDVTLQVDVSALAGSPEEIIFKVASLKRNLFAAVFNKYFQLQASGTAPADGTPTVIKHRPTETMYISAHKDRVTVIFSTIFSDEDDVVFGRLFLQEFAEARVRVCSVCVCACVCACVRACVCVCVQRVCVSVCLSLCLCATEQRISWTLFNTSESGTSIRVTKKPALQCATEAPQSTAQRGRGRGRGTYSNTSNALYGLASPTFSC